MSEPSNSPRRLNADEGFAYDGTFWLAYLANLSLVSANALSFRFAELVDSLGGNEQKTGSIVGISIIAALVVRFVMGQGIDRYGVRMLWALSAALFVAGNAMFILCRDISWEIYLARTLFAIGLAGMFTCSIVHVQMRAPTHRRTEIIGFLGSSGFLGMILGSQLGDFLFRFSTNGHERFVWLFGTAVGFGVLYLAIVLWITRYDVHTRPHETPAAYKLIFRYWPGPIVLVALMMGVGFSVTGVFLTRYATSLGVKEIGTFFTSYALSAFLFRMLSRTWSTSIGRHPMVLLGLGGHAIGHFLLPFVTNQWEFVLPAVCCGFGHAMLFPVVVSLGSGAFPRQYRGTGTTIVLGFTELGFALSSPPLGAIIDHVGFNTMFVVSGAITVMIGVGYALTAARRPDEDLQENIPIEGELSVAEMETVPAALEIDPTADSQIIRRVEHCES